VFSVCVPRDIPITLAPREHLQYAWLPLLEAADRCFSGSNAEAILQLPRETICLCSIIRYWRIFVLQVQQGIRRNKMIEQASTEKVKNVGANDDVLCIELLNGLRLMGPMRTRPVYRDPVAVAESQARQQAEYLPSAV
jgi:hypothetical protein